mgnify:CR=1 FL=1
MADFTLQIKERVLLNGTERGTDYNLTIPNIENYDNRIVTVPSGSETTIFQYSDKPGSGGTFMLSTSDITGSLTNTFTYDDIMSVFVEPSGSSAKVEYFIATT